MEGTKIGKHIILIDARAYAQTGQHINSIERAYAQTGQHINSIDEVMNVVSKMAKARHARTAMVILSICVAGCLFTGAPLVNAQAEESPELAERIARIEGILEQMNERLEALNHLGDQIDALHSDINSWDMRMLIAIASIVVLSPISNALTKRFIEKKA